jgi:hypothetical protein
MSATGPRYLKVRAGSLKVGDIITTKKHPTALTVSDMKSQEGMFAISAEGVSQLIPSDVVVFKMTPEAAAKFKSSGNVIHLRLLNRIFEDATS